MTVISNGATDPIDLGVNPTQERLAKVQRGTISANFATALSTETMNDGSLSQEFVTRRRQAV